MGIDNLLKKLEEQPKTVGEQWGQKRAEWIEDVAALMANIRQWLAPAIAKKLVTVEARKVELDEPDTGPYEVDALTIYLGDREVAVEPKGMRVVGIIPAGGKRIVGARGRVDLVSGPSRATLLRRSDRSWQLATVDGWGPGREAVPVDADRLADALAELIG
jgi:hypothetical protein